MTGEEDILSALKTLGVNPADIQRLAQYWIEFDLRAGDGDMQARGRILNTLKDALKGVDQPKVTLVSVNTPMGTEILNMVDRERGRFIAPARLAYRFIYEDAKGIPQLGFLNSDTWVEVERPAHSSLEDLPFALVFTLRGLVKEFGLTDVSDALTGINLEK